MLVPTLADKGYHVVSVMDPYGNILGFLDRKLICGNCVSMPAQVIESETFLIDISMDFKEAILYEYYIILNIVEIQTP
jgi:hypothetical protein